MKSRAEQLDEMSRAILIATDRMRYYKQQDKMLQSEIKRLTRNERTHRLCTRGGMIEAFIQEPEKLSDDQVMELLTVAFRQPAVSDLLQEMLEEVRRDAAGHVAAVSEFVRQYTLAGGGPYCDCGYKKKQ